MLNILCIQSNTFREYQVQTQIGLNQTLTQPNIFGCLEKNIIFLKNKLITMKTPNELFEMFAVIATEAKCGITDLMMKHNVTTLNTAEAMYDYGFDFVDISVYDRKNGCNVL